MLTWKETSTTKGKTDTDEERYVLFFGVDYQAVEPDEDQHEEEERDEEHGEDKEAQNEEKDEEEEEEHDKEEDEDDEEPVCFYNCAIATITNCNSPEKVWAEAGRNRRLTQLRQSVPLVQANQFPLERNFWNISKWITLLLCWTIFWNSSKGVLLYF